MSVQKFSGLVTAFVLLFLFAFGVILSVFVINNDDIQNSDNALSKIIKSLGLQKKPFNILVMGVDRVAQNSDTILLVNFNPSSGKVNILSIPRDTKIKLKNKTAKINAAYVQGKGPMAKETVSKLLNIPVSNYVAIDTEAFVKIVDIVDGVRINVPMDMDYDDPLQNLHIHLKKGEQLLNGKKAEQYMRYRKGYDEGDLGRVEAQKLFIKELIKQKLTPAYILKSKQIISTVFKYLETDLKLNESLKYVALLKEINPENINLFTLPGEPGRENLWYFVYDREKTALLINRYFSGGGSKHAGNLDNGVNPQETGDNSKNEKVIIDTDKYKEPAQKEENKVKPKATDTEGPEGAKNHDSGKKDTKKENGVTAKEGSATTSKDSSGVIVIEPAP